MKTYKLYRLEYFMEDSKWKEKRTHQSNEIRLHPDRFERLATNDDGIMVWSKFTGT